MAMFFVVVAKETSLPYLKVTCDFHPFVIKFTVYMQRKRLSNLIKCSYLIKIEIGVTT